MKMKRKNKIRLIGFLIITIILFTSFKPINVIAVDDNYSTYLFNQDINVNKDEAHLLSEQSDGSNSYRNLFQSNFLFPAKLQSNMLSTSQTSSFSHYSFNQFYFDNLDNKYAYQSNDNSQNFETSIVPNEFDVLNGNNIINGSLENQDSSFGKYNATYNFDNYSETENNYGNYNGTYSFENDIGLFGKDISFVVSSSNENNQEVISNLNNHNSILKFIDNSGYTEIASYLDNTYSNGKIQLWIYKNYSSGQMRMYIKESLNTFHLRFYNNYLSMWNGSVLADFNANIWYYLEVEWFSDNTHSVYWNDICVGNKLPMNNNFTNGINTLSFVSYTNDITEALCIDGLGYIFYDDYNENDNTNPYGLQSELENYGFEINNNYGNSISINQESSFYNNVLNITDNSLLSNSVIIPLNNSISEGIIEFYFKTTNVNKWNFMYFQREGSYPNAISTAIQSSNFRYVDDISGWSDIPNVEIPENNKWYHIKMVFNITTTNSIIYYVNGISSGILYTSSGYSYISKMFIGTATADLGYSIVINNIDFNWSNGYYDNRIQNLIPLNDSNYNMYKRESFDSNNLFHKYYIVPNGNMFQQWSSPDYSNIENYPSSDTGTKVYADSSDDGQSNQWSFNGTDLENEVIYKIEMKYVFTNDYNYGSHTDDSSFQLRVGSEVIEHVDMIYGQQYDKDWLSYTFYNLSIIELSDINIYWTAYSSITIPYDYPLAIYTLGLELYTTNLSLIVEKELDINYNENGKPILHNLYYSYCSNYNNTILFYIYNYDLANYYLVNESINYLNFELNSFIFNESAYFRLGKFKFRIESYDIYQFNLYFDSLTLNITYVIQNNNGYQELIAYNHRFKTDDSYKGYSKFELLIFNDSIKYRYSEINFEMDDYIYAWFEYNTSNIDVQNIELQSHCRYGLNTLDIEIINFYYIIYINYDIMLEFREQSRKELATHKIKSSFNYTSYTRNYLDLTGIIGNYSYNTFKGCRSLYGATTEIFHRNFQIPYFSDDIDVSIPLVLPDDSFSNPAEPEPPTSYYWEYETFKTEYYQDVNINIGNWSVQFSQMRSTTYQAKYFYQPNSVSKDDLGSWKWKIRFSDTFSYTIDFNFMRNAVKSIINLILLFGQWIGYLALASASYIFMYLGTTILVFLWNTLVYALFYALIYVLWYLYEGLFLLLNYIWLGLIWVYETLLIPFFEWFWNICIPWIIDFVIIILAHIITLAIFAITLGQIDYDSTYDTVYLMLRYIADEIIEAILVFTKNLAYILLFVLYYLLLIGLLYIRYIYVKARGFNNRADQLHKAFEVFSLPIVWTIDLFRETKELVNPYS